MPEITITLTAEDMKRLHKRAADERRPPENMALYLVAKALKPRSPAKRKPVARKAKAAK